jgi:hypothetical protein
VPELVVTRGQCGPDRTPLRVQVVHSELLRARSRIGAAALLRVHERHDVMPVLGLEQLGGLLATIETFSSTGATAFPTAYNRCES